MWMRIEAPGDRASTVGRGWRMGQTVGLPARRSIRLQGFDYANDGAYFVTIVARERKCLFGEVVSDHVVASEIGRVVDAEWQRTPSLRPEVKLGDYVLMPNHLHALVFIERTGRRGDLRSPAEALDNTASGPCGPRSNSLSAVVAGFKSAATRQCRDRGLLWSGASLWQRNFYEHIVRNEGEHAQICDYIEQNPLRCAEDPENPV